MSCARSHFHLFRDFILFLCILHNCAHLSHIHLLYQQKKENKNAHDDDENTTNTYTIVQISHSKTILKLHESACCRFSFINQIKPQKKTESKQNIPTLLRFKIAATNQYEAKTRKIYNKNNIALIYEFKAEMMKYKMKIVYFE